MAIAISSSHHVEVYGNTVNNNANGIVGMEWGRETGTVCGAYRLDFLNVHDNTVTGSTQWQDGVVQGVGDLTVFDRNLTFSNNLYNGGAFAWLNATRSCSYWQSVFPTENC